MSDAAPGTGDVLGGRYALRRLLGRGGMAQVFEAFDERLTRPVAIKVLTGSPASDTARFSAEIRTLARLDHPNIVRLLDAGELPDGRAYLVMELVSGASLQSRCAAGALAGAEVARIGAEIARGLAYVHARGVVHRDVKPANILLGPDERVRLADFGIARLVDTAGLTATGLVLGTPAYLAPEQLAGRGAGPATDLYALGLVLAECLTGVRVFDGTPGEIAAARLVARPLALDSVETSWHPLLAALTDPEPAQRPSADEAARALRARVDDAATTQVLTSPPPAPDPVTAWVPTSVTTASGTTAVAPAGPATTPGGPAPAPRRRPRRRAVLVPLVVLVAIGVGFGLEQALSPTAPAAHHGTSGTAAFSVTVRRSGPGRSTTSSTTSSSSTSTSTTTSTTSTTTTVAPTTTTPATINPAAAEQAAAGLAGALVTGAQSGTVAPAAIGVLAGDLQAIAHNAAAPAAGIQRFANDFLQAVRSGAVTGASVAQIQSGITALARALGVAPPAAPTAAAPGGSGTAPGQPTGPGQGIPPGHGDGDGPGHGHGQH